MNTISKLNYAAVSDAYAACEDYMAAKGKPVDLVPQVAHKLMLNQQFWAVIERAGGVVQLVPVHRITDVVDPPQATDHAYCKPMEIGVHTY